MHCILAILLSTVLGTPPQTTEQSTNNKCSIDLSTMLIGTRGGIQGTAFVISRQHRLIVTAAHVADSIARHNVTLLAIPNHSATSYAVERVWYHPGLVRKLDDGLYAQSADPKDGLVAHNVPDIAVLQLSFSGPDLPAEVTLASKDDKLDHPYPRIHILGFPGSSTRNWPRLTEPTTATLLDGQITNLTSTVLNHTSQLSNTYTMRIKLHAVPGFSGGPIFLDTGHVVGVLSLVEDNNCSSSDFEDVAYHADCIRETLNYHSLPGSTHVSPCTVSQLLLWPPDPRLPGYRRAARLIREAKLALHAKDYYAASCKCNEALTVEPTYVGALLLRSTIYLNYGAILLNLGSPDEARKYLDWAIMDSKKGIELFPEWNSLYPVYLQAIIYSACLPDAAVDFTEILHWVEQLFQHDRSTNQFTSQQLSYIINCRAQCYQFLGDTRRAEIDFGTSIELSPKNPRWLLNRAQFWNTLGMHDKAQLDTTHALSIGN